jgi:predicted nucleic acid-binding protein
MKSLVFDSGPLISLTMNNILWIVEPLKKAFKGGFYIPEAVKMELVDEPLQTKKFKFEALQVQELISRGVLEVLEDEETKEETLSLLAVANSCFSAKGQNLTIVHYGEVASVVAAMRLNASALVMDERVTRELIEHPQHLAGIMGKKLQTRVNVESTRLAELKKRTGSISIIRSTELATVAFEQGLLDRYASQPSQRKTVLESVLWGLKLDGCAINERGIKAIMAAEQKR